MIVKYQALAHLKQNTQALYVLTGNDPYLINDAQRQIKDAFFNGVIPEERDYYSLTIQAPSEWTNILAIANNLSLFSTRKLINVYYDKKTFDKSSKEKIQLYLENYSPDSLIIINAPPVNIKDLTWLTQDKRSIVIQITPYSSQMLQKWVKDQLITLQFKFNEEIVSLITAYTEHNMLATSQIIEKLALLNPEDKTLSPELVKDLIINESQYQNYVFIDNCLLGNFAKIRNFLTLAKAQKTEPLFLLWLLTTLLRELLELSYLQNNMPIPKACEKLKIWPQKVGMYEKLLKKFTRIKLSQLLQACARLDRLIKTHQNSLVWEEIEQLALEFC